MKVQNWCARPHAPLRHPERYYEPYICRLSPADSSFTLEWLDNGSDGGHTLYYRLRGSEDEWLSLPLTEKTATVSGLTNLLDYEFYIERDDKSGRSRTRLVNPCDAPGVVINYIHPEDSYFDFAGNFLGTPNIFVLPSGNYIATHDVFGKSEHGFAFVFISRDKGKTWEYQCELHPFRECKPFVHNGRFYMIGGLAKDIGITESLDEGRTWSKPVTLFRTDSYFNGVQRSMVQLSETPVIEHNGRIVFSFEIGAWALIGPQGFESSMMSAPADADLLDADSWEYVPLTTAPQDKILPKLDKIKCDYVFEIEGNPISGPDGELYNLIRINHMIAEDICNSDYSVPYNMASLYRFRSFDEPLEFVQTVDIPVGLRKMFFTMRDEKTGLYFTLGNESYDLAPKRRCIYTLSVSSDLRNWRKLKELINCSDREGYCVSQPSFAFDGDDLCYLSRTAWGKVKDQHDNNMMTFHVEKNFRNLL